jgi:hypothetical protein
MATKIQIRRGIASSWTSANPVLSSGEIGFETDTNKVKIGNGSTDWNSLSYFSDVSQYLTLSSASTTYLTQASASATYIPQTSQQGIINSASAAAVAYLVDSAPETLDTLNELAAALNDDANFSTTVTNSLANKLDASSASTTYLTQSSASEIYLTQSSASTTYEPINLQINTQSESYTLALADTTKIVQMNVATANNLTIPQNSSIEFPIGTNIDIIQIGAGQTTLVADTNVTINSKNNALKLTGQWSGVSIYKRDTNTWVAIGDLTS